MPRFSQDFDVISIKKGLQEKMPQFSQDFNVIKKKKSSSVFHRLISQCHFDVPSAGFLKPSGLMMGPSEAHGPPKVHGPRDHCPPLPLLS